jgi:hypothetical protein
MDEQIEHLRLERDGFTAPAQRAAFDVEHKIVEREGHRSSWLTGLTAAS